MSLGGQKLSAHVSEEKYVQANSLNESLDFLSLTSQRKKEKGKNLSHTFDLGFVLKPNFWEKKGVLQRVRLTVEVSTVFSQAWKGMRESNRKGSTRNEYTGETGQTRGVTEVNSCSEWPVHLSKQEMCRTSSLSYPCF